MLSLDGRRSGRTCTGCGEDEVDVEESMDSDLRAAMAASKAQHEGEEEPLRAALAASQAQDEEERAIAAALAASLRDTHASASGGRAEGGLGFGADTCSPFSMAPSRQNAAAAAVAMPDSDAGLHAARPGRPSGGPAVAAAGPGEGHQADASTSTCAPEEYERLLDGLQGALDSGDDTWAEAWYAELIEFLAKLSREDKEIIADSELPRWPEERRRQMRLACEAKGLRPPRPVGAQSEDADWTSTAWTDVKQGWDSMRTTWAKWTGGSSGSG
eukprot:gnl/TRDRNA2_/TRDRNA2_39955_c0_seq1.p1 gnl/TRDRNA2_/TRDRNA2_39955_c0~~gnl/TRDRNA2_/TRDRNA2_39955_c0_seq1.p1  ORF type:complete len:272 (+),score=56.58 gnl/TRDRNA2_/TRDRNA2_39955_c0_seq1:65-880(+)